MNAFLHPQPDPNNTSQEKTDANRITQELGGAEHQALVDYLKQKYPNITDAMRPSVLQITAGTEFSDELKAFIEDARGQVRTTLRSTMGEHIRESFKAALEANDATKAQLVIINAEKLGIDLSDIEREVKTTLDLGETRAQTIPPTEPPSSPDEWDMPAIPKPAPLGVSADQGLSTPPSDQGLQRNTR